MSTEDKENGELKGGKKANNLRQVASCRDFTPTLDKDKTRLDSNVTQESNKNEELKAPTLYMSPSTPTFSNAIQVTPQRSNSEKRRQFRDEAKQRSRRKPKKPVLYGAASPAEVFHRNLVDAVSNVEDSDENEHYVYPYSGADSSHLTDIQSSGMHRPLSVRSTPSTLFYEPRPTRIPTQSKSIGEWLRRTLSRQKEATEEEEGGGEEEEGTDYRRPKLRSNLKDPLSELGQKGLVGRVQDRWSKKNRASTYPPMQYDAGYTSDDEDRPLLGPQSTKRSKPPKKSYVNKLYSSLGISFLFLFCFICAMLYNVAPLDNLTIEVGRVLATDKELIFDLKVRAENWNWWVVHIADVDISVFAFSDIVPLRSQGVDPAEYLGSLTRFDEPLAIPSSVRQPALKEVVSQIRIKSPGADTSGNERWSRIIRYPYGLVVRGVLKYQKMSLYHALSITVCNVTQVNPISRAVSPCPDTAYCLNPDESSLLSISHAGQDCLLSIKVVEA
ncbi:hypothetical protein BY458DRAFT_475299 [Sporodiniella umbellata]|nr:hypothetical protein BY458DRAFT_475299 [Sporodiniella umbellata]